MDSQRGFIGPVIDFVDKGHNGITTCFQFYNLLWCGLKNFSFDHSFVPIRPQRVILGIIPNCFLGFVDEYRMMYGDVDFLHEPMISGFGMQRSLAALRLYGESWNAFFLRTFCRDAAKIFTIHN